MCYDVVGCDDMFEFCKETLLFNKKGFSFCEKKSLFILEAL